MKQLRVFLVGDATGALEAQVMVDGDVSFDEATVITRQVEEVLGRSIPGFAINGDIESHRAGGPRHVHLVSTTGQRIG